MSSSEAPDTWWLPMSVRRPSNGYISKNKQDRPIVFYGRQYRPYRKLGSLIPLSVWGDILVSNEKYVQTTMFDFGIKSQLLSTEQTVISPPVLSTVVSKSVALRICWSQSSSVVLTTPKSNRRRASFFSQLVRRSCWICESNMWRV